MGGWSRDLGVMTPDQVDDVLRERTADLRAQWARDEAHPMQSGNVARLGEALKAGIGAMGGKAHVHAGAHYRVEENGDTQNSITFTLTVATRRSGAPVVQHPEGVRRKAEEL